MTKHTNEKQPAAGRWQGQLEDRAFRLKVEARRLRNQTARKARKHK